MKFETCFPTLYQEFTQEPANVETFLELLSDCTRERIDPKILEPLGEVLSSWLEKGGMPIIKLDQTTEDEIRVSQFPSCKAIDKAWICPSDDEIWKVLDLAHLKDYANNLEKGKYYQTRMSKFLK